MGTKFSDGSDSITYYNTNTFTIVTVPSITYISTGFNDITIKYSGNQNITKKTYKYYDTKSISVPTSANYNSIANIMNYFTSTNLYVSIGYIYDNNNEPQHYNLYFICKDLIISNSAGDSLPYISNWISSSPTVFYYKCPSK